MSVQESLLAVMSLCDIMWLTRHTAASRESCRLHASVRHQYVTQHSSEAEDSCTNTGTRASFPKVLHLYVEASAVLAQHDHTVVQVHLVERIPWHEALYFVTTTLTTGTQY